MKLISAVGTLNACPKYWMLAGYYLMLKWKKIKMNKK